MQVWHAYITCTSARKMAVNANGRPADRLVMARTGSSRTFFKRTSIHFRGSDLTASQADCKSALVMRSNAMNAFSKAPLCFVRSITSRSHSPEWEFENRNKKALQAEGYAHRTQWLLGPQSDGSLPAPDGCLQSGEPFQAELLPIETTL